jgi:hypothetical protein
MENDLLNALPKAAPLNLGRVGGGGARVTSTDRFQAADTTLTDALLNIGNTFAKQSIESTKKKQFYEGQTRVLNASLEGRQKEELQTIVNEQPYFFDLLGQGAVAEGAIDMASRVGAGKMFDEYNAKLASGEDIEMSPDDYKEQVFNTIESHKTGDPTVDAVFLPQMIASGQKLVAAQLSKHLEHNAKQASQAVVNETTDALNSLEAVTQAEQGVTATFDGRVPREAMTTSQQFSYDRAKESLDPKLRPKSVDQEAWADIKVLTLVPLIERGNTAAYEVAKQSGLMEVLNPEQRNKLDAAKTKGKTLNDANNSLFLIDREAALEDMILDTDETADIGKVFAEAKSIQKAYDVAGVTRPDDFKDDAAIKAKIKRAQAQKNAEDDKKENRAFAEAQRIRDRNDRRAEAMAEKIAGMQQQEAMLTQIMGNAKAANVNAPVAVRNIDGSISNVPVTPQMKQDAFDKFKSNYINAQAQGAGDQMLAATGFKSVTQAAYALGVVDTEVAGRAKYWIDGTAGQPELKKDAVGALNAVEAVYNETKDKAYVGRYLPDEKQRALFFNYLDRKKFAGNSPTAQAESWKTTFGRDRSKPVAVDTKTVNKEVAKALKDELKQAGVYSTELQGMANAYATDLVATGFATPAEVGERTKEYINARTEVINGQVIPSVPYTSSIAGKTGFKPKTAEVALKYVAKEKYGLDKFHLRYEERSDKHYVYKLNEDGEPIAGTEQAVDYNELVNALNSGAALKKKGSGRFSSINVNR